ncbi:MAG: hypothetical protein NZL85_03810 [Fimbriimonadales bacterium]|nr:hypothetical protein [Fimbriimonadales bacterium]
MDKLRSAGSDPIEPEQILETCYQEASTRLDQPVISDSRAVAWIEQICQSRNRAPARFLLACGLAKAHRPELDIRKPFTEINEPDAYSGRYYDENYITNFINKYQIPLNPTTAFLTPAFRTFNQPLFRHVRLSGRPRQIYDALLQLLDTVQSGTLSARELLIEAIRQLILLRNRRQQDIATLQREVRLKRDNLTVETILRLLEQHLASPRSSRLPVLMVAAAYNVAQAYLKKQLRPLQPHTAADIRTGVLGDLEIVSQDSQQLAIVYEMKTRHLTRGDLDRALQKVATTYSRIDQYVFITTTPVESAVAEYAALLSKQSGTEFMILDCLQFIKHFLHIFYELRIHFLDEYQRLLLEEPESAVSYQLKQRFLELLKSTVSISDESQE